MFHMGQQIWYIVGYAVFHLSVNQHVQNVSLNALASNVHLLNLLQPAFVFMV
jgi:hypothetical protein